MHAAPRHAPDKLGREEREKELRGAACGSAPAKACWSSRQAPPAGGLRVRARARGKEWGAKRLLMDWMGHWECGLAAAGREGHAGERAGSVQARTAHAAGQPRAAGDDRRRRAFTGALEFVGSGSTTVQRACITGGTPASARRRRRRRSRRAGGRAGGAAERHWRRHRHCGRPLWVSGAA